MCVRVWSCVCVCVCVCVRVCDRKKTLAKQRDYVLRVFLLFCVYDRERQRTGQEKERGSKRVGER